MNAIQKCVVLSLLVTVIALAIPPVHAADAAKLDTAKIEQAIGAKGQMNAEEGVFKVSIPRTDVKVTVDGTPMPPFMGLTSWAAFQPGMKDGAAMVMGDMVLMQDEVNPAMSAALDNGLAVTALHNHFFYDEPKVYFMHIGGEGDAVKLATAVRKVQEKIKEIRAAAPQLATRFGVAALAEKSSITPAPLESELGKGQTNEGM